MIGRRQFARLRRRAIKARAGVRQPDAAPHQLLDYAGSAERFIREVKAVARLLSPNIVAFYVWPRTALGISKNDCGLVSWLVNIMDLGLYSGYIHPEPVKSQLFLEPKD